MNMVDAANSQYVGMTAATAAATPKKATAAMMTLSLAR
jgi:hypothetical protein